MKNQMTRVPKTGSGQTTQGNLNNVLPARHGVLFCAHQPERDPFAPGLRWAEAEPSGMSSALWCGAIFG
jgi:hypothetical protein